MMHYIPSTDFYLRATEKTAGMLVASALEKHFVSVGIGNYHTDIESARRFSETIKALKERYHGQIHVFSVAECDRFNSETGQYADVVLGNVRHLDWDGKRWTLPQTEEEFHQFVNRLPHRNLQMFAREYYAELSLLPALTGCTFVGGIDVWNTFGLHLLQPPVNGNPYLGLQNALEKLKQNSAVLVLKSADCKKKEKADARVTKYLCEQLRRQKSDVTFASFGAKPEDIGKDGFDCCDLLVRYADVPVSVYLESGREVCILEEEAGDLPNGLQKIHKE